MKFIFCFVIHEQWTICNTTVIRLKRVEYHLVVRISGLVLRCCFGNQLNQRRLLKRIHA